MDERNGGWLERVGGWEGRRVIDEWMNRLTGGD